MINDSRGSVKEFISNVAYVHGLCASEKTWYTSRPQHVWLCVHNLCGFVSHVFIPYGACCPGFMWLYKPQVVHECGHPVHILCLCPWYVWLCRVYDFNYV